jgi:hypothetical protein
MRNHLHLLYLNNQNSRMYPENNRFSQKIIVFHERSAPEEEAIVGYAAFN